MRRLAAVVSLGIALCVAGLAWAQFSVEGQIKAVLDGWVAKPPGKLTAFRYGSVTYDIAQRRTVVTDLEFAGPKGRDAELAKIGRVELIDFNPAMIQKIADPALYREGKGDGAFARIVGQALLLDFQMRDGDTRIAIREMQAGEVAGRQFDVPPDAFPKDGGGKVVALVMPAFRAASFDIFGFQVRDKQDSGVSIDRFSATGIDAGRFGSFITDRMTAVEKGVETVTTNEVVVRGLDLTRAMPDFAAGRTPAMRDPARKIDIDEFRVRGLSGKKLEEQGIRFGEMVVSATRSPDRMNERFTMRMAGLELGRGTSPASEVTQALSAVGYQVLPISWICEGANDYAKQTAAVEKCDLVADGAATVSLVYTLGGMKPDSFSGNPDDAMAGLMDMDLLRLQLSVRDSSLFDRVLAFAAQQEGKTAAAKRAELVQQIRLGSAGFTQGSQRLQEAVQAILAFVGKPGSLTIDLAPPAPVKFSEFNAAMAADPAGTAEKLGLKVRAAP